MIIVECLSPDDVYIKNISVKSNFGLNLSRKWLDMESAIPLKTHLLNLRVLLKKIDFFLFFVICF